MIVAAFVAGFLYGLVVADANPLSAYYGWLRNRRPIVGYRVVDPARYRVYFPDWQPPTSAVEASPIQEQESER